MSSADDPRRLRSRPRADAFHNVLALVITIIFAAICFATYAIITGKSDLESWAAGIVGAVLGYWANNVTQVISYYFGSSSHQRRRDDDAVVPVSAVRMLESEGRPPETFGRDGDYCRDRVTGVVYGPKQDGRWGAERSP